MGDILEHNILFKVYPELANYEVEIIDMKNRGGSFNKNDKVIKLNCNIKNKQAQLGTLIYEIQHAIQHIENFEGGRSSKGSKLAYYNSLGEIEADDTKRI